MADKAIGIRLKEARESVGLTQQKVCEMLGIPKTQTLSAYESGVNNPPIEVLKGLSQLYHVSIDWIAFGEESLLAKQKKTSECIVELFKIVDRLGLCFCEEDDWNGNPTGNYVIYVENKNRKGFNNLIIDLGRINGIRDSLEPDEYEMLFKNKINKYAKESNDYEEIDECSDTVNDSTKTGVLDVGGEDLPF